jgi:hypothetical protein
MSQQDLRTFTSLGEKLLQDHNDSFRKEIGQKLEGILSRLDTLDSLSKEQRDVLESFKFCGRSIVSKAAKILP